ncbi:MAG: hypothetical protein B7Z55_17945, partial [Planctomycetales bacterium 12-60-4]
LPDPSKALVISATGRSPVSLLAYYLPGQPRVYRWNPTGIVESQHEIWGGPQENLRGSNALIATHVGQEIPPELAAAFRSIEPAGIKETHLGGRRWEKLQLWRGRGFLEWPDPAAASLRLAETAAGASRR